MLPEISHRCPSCGVSVRERDALFCPECGKPLSEKAAEKPDAASELSANEAASSVQPARTKAPAVAVDTKDGQTAHPVQRRGERARERLHRASEVAREVTRGVIEEPVKRVEKIRQASTVVIEEASYDPSLRFVIVALGLFVIFVILLVVSKVMG